jgi:signal transduction histidine kinase
VLPARCGRDPDAAAELARELAVDARQAALEARMLMADLRPGAAPAQSLAEALRVRAKTFAERSGVPVELVDSARAEHGCVSQQDTHELLRIVGEAMTNAVTHGGASRLEVAVRHDVDRALVVSVTDDGGGLGGPIDLERLKAAGHFGLAGMHERARAMGATLRIEARAQGTSVTVRLAPPSGDEASMVPVARRFARRWPVRRRRGVPELQAATKEPT